MKTDFYNNLEAGEKSLVQETIKHHFGGMRDLSTVLRLGNPTVTIHVADTAKESFVRIEKKESEVFALLLKNYC